MRDVSPPRLREHLATADRLAGEPAKTEAQYTALAAMLQPLLAVADRVGPWPRETPAGPHDPSV